MTTSPEFDAICGCLRATPVAPRTALDGSRFLRLAEGHGVAPLLFRHAGTFPELATVREELRQRYHASLARGIRLGELVAELATAFEAAGVSALAYRGPVLSALAHGNVGCRVFEDLDFLVRDAEMERARAVLASRGYAAFAGFPPHIERQRLRWSSELGMTKPGGVMVELHRALTARAFALPLATAELWRRTQSVEVGGRTVATLATAETLWMLCVRAAQPKCGWNRLSLACDVAALTRRAELDWERAWWLAERTRTRRVLLLGLALAESLLGANVPEMFRLPMWGDATATALASEVRQRLASGAMELSAREKWRFSLRVRERRRDGWRLGAWKLFCPTEPDWLAVRLPAGLAFAYTLVRPCRLAKNAVANRRVQSYPDGQKETR